MVYPTTEGVDYTMSTPTPTQPDINYILQVTATLILLLTIITLIKEVG